MEDKQARAAARKQAIKEILEGVGMIVFAAVCRLLAGDLNFVEGVTTRYEGQSYMYLMAAAAGLLFVGAVLLVVGLVHLVKPGKSGKNTK